MERGKDEAMPVQAGHTSDGVCDPERTKTSEITKKDDKGKKSGGGGSSAKEKD